MPQAFWSITAQAFDFAPALCFNLGFTGLTGWLFWLCFGDRLGDVRRRMTILVTVGIFGLGFVGYLSLGLAMVGRFSVGSFFGVWAVVVTLLAVAGWRRGRWKAHLAQWRSAQPLPVWSLLLLLLWLVLYIRPFDLVTGGRDPGVYVNVAAQVAEQRGLAVADPFLADLDPAIQSQLEWNPYWLPSFIPFKWPGFFWMDSTSDRPGMVLPQFFHMYPALMAPAYAVLGYRGALTILPIVILVFALVLAEIAGHLFQSWSGNGGGSATTMRPSFVAELSVLLPPVFFLLNPAIYWFGRFANADVPYGLFVFAALLFWVRAAGAGDQGWLNWPLALLCLGAALLTKIDSLYLLPGVVVTAQVFHPARGAAHRGARLIAWAAVCAFYLAAVYGFSYPYVLSTLRTSGFEVSTERAEAVLLAAGYLIIITAAGLTPPLLAANRWGRLRIRWRLPSASLPLAVGAACLLSLGLLVVAQPDVPSAHLAFDALLAYVPWPMLLVGLAGIILLVLRVGESVLALPLLAIFFSSGLFILLQTSFTDHPWSERRATSIALPFLMLCAGIAVGEFFRWVMSVASSGDRSEHFGTMRRAGRYAAAAAVLIVALMPMAWRIPSIFAHQEAEGARSQLRLLDSIFPKNVVILSGGTRAMDLFGPGLSVAGGREVLTFYSSAATPVIPTEIVEQVGDAALAAGRPFFFVAPGDGPPPGHFLWARAWWDKWTLRQMVSRDSPQPLQVEEAPIQSRVYRAISVAPVAGSAMSQVRLYEAEGLLSQTGRMAEDAAASNGWVREAEAERDAAGALVYGPYVELPPGSYKARYRLRAEGDAGDRLATLVVLGAGVRQIASRQIDSAVPVYSDFDVSFDLPQAEKVEFGLLFRDAGHVWLDWVEVVPLAQLR